MLTKQQKEKALKTIQSYKNDGKLFCKDMKGAEKMFKDIFKNKEMKKSLISWFSALNQSQLLFTFSLGEEKSSEIISSRFLKMLEKAGLIKINF